MHLYEVIHLYLLTEEQTLIQLNYYSLIVAGRRQNFCPSLFHLVDRLYTVIHKMRKTRTKVLPSATVGNY